MRIREARDVVDQDDQEGAEISSRFRVNHFATSRAKLISLKIGQLMGGIALRAVFPAFGPETNMTGFVTELVLLHFCKLLIC
jgi:hypothetical protein